MSGYFAAAVPKIVTDVYHEVCTRYAHNIQSVQISANTAS